MQAPTVMNMTSSSGNKVKNQFLIWTDKGQYFQSYQTVIAFRDNEGNVTLDRGRWDYSTTTGKYRNSFLGMNKAQTEKAIKAGCDWYLTKPLDLNILQDLIAKYLV